MKNEIDGWVFNKDYNHPNLTPAMIELVRRHKSCFYLAKIADGMMKETGAENRENIEKIAYVGGKEIEKQEQAKKDADMVAQGWRVIPSIESARIADPFTYRGPAMLKASKDIDWLSCAIETTGKIISSQINDHEVPFFIPKGKRSRGYYLQTLTGYWKPL